MTQLTNFAASFSSGVAFFVELSSEIYLTAIILYPP
jgi:hypothetical protein